MSPQPRFIGPRTAPPPKAERDASARRIALQLIVSVVLEERDLYFLAALLGMSNQDGTRRAVLNDRLAWVMADDPKAWAIGCALLDPLLLGDEGGPAVDRLQNLPAQLRDASPNALVAQVWRMARRGGPWSRLIPGVARDVEVELLRRSGRDARSQRRAI